MELGIFSRTYEYSDPHLSFGKISGHGLHRCQLNLSNGGMPTLPETRDEKKLAGLKSALELHNIKCDGLSGTFNMIDPDRDAKERGIRQFQLQCELAGELGIPLVSLCTGSKNPKSKWEWHEDNLKLSSWAERLGSMRQVLDEAFDALGRDIVSAHAKDLYPDGSGKILYTAPGKGVLDFEYYTLRLKRAGYEGSLIMHGFAEAEVPSARDYLKNIM